jgi:SAM-dependent methyltransferase
MVACQASRARRGARHMSMRRHAPATLRNREPIAAVLAEALPASGLVLEVASGSGEHVAFFAERFPALTWRPSDPDGDSLASIADWCAGLTNVLPPLALDAAEADWPMAAADAILCINMVHISPWGATLGLMAGAGRLLAAGAPLILYGPYRQRNVPTAESNEAFDVSLRSRNPAWGLRHVEDVSAAAAERGLLLERIVAMPANNLSLVFRRES